MELVLADLYMTAFLAGLQHGRLETYRAFVG
jgi:hypothetical protein